ncbi:FliM/FliN family flagellar motor switch protein, partial [bacterium]|nr:FliM/FliN family flagellar motor switch protein [bacterium]
VELGTAKCTLREIMALEPNDIVILNTVTTGEIVVKVADRKKFGCQPGLYGRHRAVRVTSVVGEDT